MAIKHENNRLYMDQGELELMQAKTVLSLFIAKLLPK